MKRTLSILLTIAVLLLSYSCNETDPVYIYGNIAGKVTEEGSNNAIEGATIEISGIEQSVKTGSNGMFKFEKLPADNYTIYVSKDGYVSDSKVITVVASQTAQSDFSLLKNLPEATPSEVLLTTANNSASIELKNTRSADMEFTIQASQPWLSVSPTNGVIASKNVKILKVVADYSRIGYGEYTESVVINVGQSSLSIPILVSYTKPAYIEVTSPEAGKVYTMGTVLPINWNSNVGGTVKIELVRNGSVQQSIISSVDNYSTSNHSWGIPSLAVDAYQVRTISDYKYNHGSSNQLLSYSTELINLKPNTRYYVRAYAENPKGISYGTAVSVTTKTVDGKDPWEPTTPDENGAVDLGLSVKWAAYNVGATKPEGYGNYYAWAEVETKIDYTEGNYKFSKADTYGYYEYFLPNGLNDISGTNYDAANVNFGNGWRMPTKLEMIELVDNSTFVQTTYNEVDGIRIVGPNGNSIFLPSSGNKNEYGTYRKGEFGYYWTSDISDWGDKGSYILVWSCNAFGNWSFGVSDIPRYYGLPIRAVR